MLWNIKAAVKMMMSDKYLILQWNARKISKSTNDLYKFYLKQKISLNNNLEIRNDKI